MFTKKIKYTNLTIYSNDSYHYINNRLQTNTHERKEEEKKKKKINKKHMLYWNNSQ